MSVTKRYIVAGHAFSMTLPEDRELWDALSQYEPFEADGGEELFKLEMVSELPEITVEVEYDAPTEDGETVIRLLKAASGEWLIEMKPDHRMQVCGRMLCSPDFKKAELLVANNSLRSKLFCINNSAMVLYAFTSFSQDTLEMHSSVVVKGGKAFLFLGKSGAGKSTHSRMWLEHLQGCELMNDDNPVIRVGEDGTVTAYGSPWSGKTPCYKNISAPVGAFVQIRQCPENRIKRMSVLEAYATLYSSCSGYKTESGMADGLHRTMEKVVTGVPFFLLDCRADREAAEICSEAVCR